MNDPRLASHLREGINETHGLALLRSDRALTDCRPISLFSLQTARRFQANVDLEHQLADGV